MKNSFCVRVFCFLSCLLILSSVLVVPVAAVSPEYPRKMAAGTRCGNCGSSEVYYIGTREYDKRWIETNCPVPATYYPHEHIIVYTCDDYRCTDCGQVTGIIVDELKMCTLVWTRRVS